jgi:biotin operon repressor
VATVQQRLLDELSAAQRPLDDDVLADRLGMVRQQVNQAARALAGQGLLRRVPNADGKLVNELVSGIANSQARVAPPGESSRWLLSEDEVKAGLAAHLEARGYAVRVAWGRERGVDLEARQGELRLLVEAKGEVPRSAQQVNYFLGALGELVQRMTDPAAAYALALPDNAQYRGLVRRLPALARQRLHLTVFFVSRTPDGLQVEEDLAPRQAPAPTARLPGRTGR